MDEKTLKRAARDVWAELRRERRARAKLLSEADLIQSAERISEIAVKLQALAADAHTLAEAAPAPDEPANDVAPAKSKPKKPGGAKKSAKKAASKTAAKTKKKKKN